MDIMKKPRTYFWYLLEYLKNRDFLSVLAAISYLIFRKTHKNDRIIHTSIGTFFCRKNTNDFQFANYYYEWGVKKFILDRKNEFSVFIDAGACIGDYSILMAKLGKRCFAFELVADNAKILIKNVKLNDLEDKIKLFPYGLGDADYSASFTLDPINTGASRINRVKNSEKEKAEIRKLDTLMKEMAIDNHEHIFIKLDVEGMEPEAIRGAFKFIMHYPNITFIVEDKHSGQFPITDTFSDIALFEFGKVDEMNIYAKKIRNY
jgi:FkbM family methyltransferase